MSKSKKKCPLCSKAEFSKGYLRGLQNVAFRPKDVKFFQMKLADAQVSAEICMSCGYIILFGDHEKVADLISE